MKEVFTTIPLQYAHEGDAGADLAASEDAVLEPGTTKIVNTDLRIAVPRHIVAMVCSRSGLAAHHQVFVLNSPGIIDSGYRNKVGVILHNAGSEPFVIHKGDRIAQLLLVPIERGSTVIQDETFDVISGDLRQQQGFGSTGI